MVTPTGNGTWYSVDKQEHDRRYWLNPRGWQERFGAQFPSWAMIVDSALSDNRTPANLKIAQKQMLVYGLRKCGMKHRVACIVAGVSDKAGKNAVRVVRNAHPDVTDLVRLGFTSVHDAMQVMDLPASVQQAAAAEVWIRKNTQRQF